VFIPTDSVLRKFSSSSWSFDWNSPSDI